MIEDTYLGDGVYASFDGYHIVLDLRGQDSTTRIALESKVLNQLNIFREDAFAQLEQDQKNAESIIDEILPENKIDEL